VASTAAACAEAAGADVVRIDGAYRPPAGSMLARLALAVASLGTAIACSSGHAPRASPPAAPSASSSTAPATDNRSIGQATMEPDGTIVLMLRAEAPGGGVGEGLLRYPPGDKDYEMVKQHVGGLEPGQSKPVPPWPDR
jgi:hypothetical protein